VAYQLEFDKLLLYDSGKSGITVPVLLQVGNQVISIDAKLDTGSSHCIFQRFVGERLGLNIESGYQTRILTTTGAFIAYGHDITLYSIRF